MNKVMSAQQAVSQIESGMTRKRDNTYIEAVKSNLNKANKTVTSSSNNLAGNIHSNVDS